MKPKRKFYDFKAKYENCGTEYILKPRLSNSVREKIRKLSVAVHNAVGAGAVSRVDLMLSEDNVPYVLEINLIPGLTSKSLLPKAARGLKISFPRLCEMMLELALEQNPSYNYSGERIGEEEKRQTIGESRFREAVFAS